MSIRIGRVPASEPPFDDGPCCDHECHPAPKTFFAPRFPGPDSSSGPGSGPAGSGPGSTGPGSAGRRPAGRAGTRPRGRSTTFVPAPADPPSARAARVVLTVFFEVLTCHRPVGHLRALCGPEAYQRLGGALAGRRLAGVPVGLLRLHAFTPAPGVVEAAAVIRQGERVWALALRLENPGEKWQCVHLEVVAPPVGEKTKKPPPDAG